MNSNLLFDFTVDKAKNQIHVKREFDAELPLVWDAWTKPEILDLWWAPKPYSLKTKYMDFRNGGHWLYAMISPENEVHWCRADYTEIIPQKQYSAYDAFCDEEGKINTDFARSQWNNQFSSNAQNTEVNITIQYDSLNDLETIIQMGFKEGFTMGLSNLDQYIEAQHRLRASLKTDTKARVCHYLNFPGNTEEAFLFYRQVFQSDFIGGMQRFSELPADPNRPPLAETVKKMILHVELPILGNHILMATDAPKEMGFELIQGNNMHISLEPETKEEATRLFNELSEGGKITMPLQDMPWGAYFGEFSDRFGINWMINYQSN